MKKDTIIYIILIGILSSCTPNKIKIPKGYASVKEATLIDSSAFKDTTLAVSNIEAFLLKKYQEVDTIPDSIGYQIATFNPADLNKCGDLTGDGINDYFVVLDYMGGPTSGVFHNGKNGKAMNLNFSIMSRPGVDIKHRILDVHCEDERKEVIVFTGGGGTIGSYYDCQIYRYDDQRQEMKPIFTKTISSYEWDDSKSGKRKLQVNYIEILYTKDSCVNQFEVSDGRDLNENQDYNLEIEPFLNNSRKVYVFDEEKNEFVKK